MKKLKNCAKKIRKRPSWSDKRIDIILCLPAAGKKIRVFVVFVICWWYRPAIVVSFLQTDYDKFLGNLKAFTKDGVLEKLNAVACKIG